jgi:hypothetical protein
VDAQEKKRLGDLQVPCVDVEFLTRTHGIAWPPDGQFERDFGAWFKTLRRATKCDGGKVHRYGFEMFLQSQKLLTRNYAAARLGMQPKSLDALLPALPQLGLSKKYAVYPGIVDESLSEDLIRALPELRFRTFGTHDSFCEILHGGLRDALGIEIRELFCATSEDLGDQRMFASTWDNITFRPLSVKHSVWLDFKKPITLAPDRCSKLFYAGNYEELRPFLAGREEPRDLSFYLTIARRSA